MRKIFLALIVLGSIAVAGFAQPLVTFSGAMGPAGLGLDGTQIATNGYTTVPNATLISDPNPELVPMLFSGSVSLGYRFLPLTVSASVGYSATYAAKDTDGSTSQAYTGLGTVTAHDFFNVELRQIMPVVSVAYDLGTELGGNVFALYGSIGAGASIILDGVSMTYREATNDWPATTEGDPSPDYVTSATLPASGGPTFAVLVLPEVGGRWGFDAHQTVSLGVGAFVFVTPRTPTNAWRVEDGTTAAELTLSDAAFEWFVTLSYTFNL